MKRTKFFAVLLTMALLLGIGAAGGNLLLQGLSGSSNAQEVDNDIAGLLEGWDLPGSDLNSALSGILENAQPVEDNELSGVTTIIQALLGGTAEGESTLDTVREKLGSLGGTVTDNQLVQALVQTLMSFDFSEFDMSMLTDNAFIAALTENLGGINLSGATPVTTAPTTQSSVPGVVLTTAQPVVTTPTPTVSSSITAATSPNTQTPAIASTMPTAAVTPTTTMPSVSAYNDPSAQGQSGVGVIVDNPVSIQSYPTADTGINPVPSVPEINTDPAQQSENKVSGKMIVGIIVLLLSGVSMVAVVMVLRKKS